jgi:hypothetical protein
MSDRITETQEDEINLDTLPLLVRNNNDKLKLPIEPNWQNLALRMSEDKKLYDKELDQSLNNRSALGIEEMEYDSVQQLLGQAGRVVYEKSLSSVKNSTDVARYLDWSYQQQVGVPASASNQEEAEKHGIGARDAWSLFINIKKRLEG